MKQVANFYGFDIYELTEQEAKKACRVYPCLCAFPDNWDEDEDGEREVDISECEFDSLVEAETWCRRYRRD